MINSISYLPLTTQDTKKKGCGFTISDNGYVDRLPVPGKPQENGEKSIFKFAKTKTTF